MLVRAPLLTRPLRGLLPTLLISSPFPQSIFYPEPPSALSKPDQATQFCLKLSSDYSIYFIYNFVIYLE